MCMVHANARRPCLELEILGRNLARSPSEEAVCAALDAKVAKAIPVHWGAFSLALHHWKEPITRFVSEAEHKQQAFLSPALGAIINLDENTSDLWWESYE